MKRKVEFTQNKIYFLKKQIFEIQQRRTRMLTFYLVNIFLCL